MSLSVVKLMVAKWTPLFSRVDILTSDVTSLYILAVGLFEFHEYIIKSKGLHTCRTNNRAIECIKEDKDTVGSGQRFSLCLVKRWGSNIL